MKEDLQVKDEQFNFLYASIKARNEQSFQCKRYEDEALRAKLMELESVIHIRDEENDNLQNQLKSATRKIQLMKNGVVSNRESPFDKLSDDIVFRVMAYMPSANLGKFLCTFRRARSLGSQGRLWKRRFEREWGDVKAAIVWSKYQQSGMRESETEPWLDLFGHHYRVSCNWGRGRGFVHSCRGHSGTVTCLAMAGAEDMKLFSGSDDGSILLWDLRPARSAHHIHGTADNCTHDTPMLPPPTLPLAQLVEGGGATGSMWPQWTSYAPSRRCNGAGAELSTLSSSPEGPSSSSWFSRPTYSPSHRDKIGFSSPSRLRSFHGHGGPVWAVDYHEDTRSLISGSYDQTIKVWDISTGQCRRTLRGHAGWVSSLSVLRGGRVVSASWDATLRVWNPETGDQTLILSSGHGNALYCLSCQPSSPYSPSPEASTLIALGCRQCEVQYWSLDTGTLLRSFLGHNKEVNSVVLSQSTCFSGSGDSTIKTWDTRTGECAFTCAEHRGSVMALQHDGNNKLVSGSYDKTVKVWDMRCAGRGSLCTLEVGDPVFCLKFNETQLVVGSTDYNFKVYDFSH
eukprot:CAMPEP_0185018994 /NCGR_PEP_ID=MMETSP1103-20130426/1630_1 /TAXON_ID=36769 /ORGANISM="Paraphysomonas bandaiensis, Strain Caron Lab Isolate" /LENGTH=568 /DNA_ID=CAMNT_0027549057 /DNA_START=204 /DNA_END=1910 /DNA_ORIENTATION=+